MRARASRTSPHPPMPRAAGPVRALGWAVGLAIVAYHVQSRTALLIMGLVAGVLVALALLPRLLFPAVERGTVGFFHPFTNDGGGGERVLWCAVRALQEESSAKIVIYSGDDLSPKQLSDRATSHFGVKILRPVEVVRLYKRRWVLPETFPRLTLIGQALGSVRLAWEALQGRVPELFIDTAGFAFTFPLARWAGSRVAAYIHYPTISTVELIPGVPDMLLRVSSRKGMYNNDARIAGSSLKSAAKLAYYYFFTALYCAVGSFAGVVMVNSNWTGAHIRRLWRVAPSLVFPPCDTTKLQGLPLDRPAGGEPYLISVAQFRPEKAHRLQIEAFAEAIRAEGAGGERRATRSSPGGVGGPKGGGLGGARLKLVGSCRHEGDAGRIAVLREDAKELGVADRVDFCVNVTHAELRALLAGAVAGLHTMVDEHFGISVVEYMAAGVIPIAHNSGGPKEDIVRPEELPEGPGGAGAQETGYLAATAGEYAAAIRAVLSLPPKERAAMAAAARKRAGRFSEEEFDRRFKEAMSPAMVA